MSFIQVSSTLMSCFECLLSSLHPSNGCQPFHNIVLGRLYSLINPSYKRRMLHRTKRMHLLGFVFHDIPTNLTWAVTSTWRRHKPQIPQNVDRVSRLEQTRALPPQLPVKNLGPVFLSYVTRRHNNILFQQQSVLFLDLFYVVVFHSLTLITRKSW